MNDIVLEVAPAAGGWWVDCDLPLEPTYFSSSADAEHTARTLALRLRDCGRDVRLRVKDLSDQIVATQRYFAL